MPLNLHFMNTRIKGARIKGARLEYSRWLTASSGFDPLIVLFACMIIAGCARDEESVGSASAQQTIPPQATTQTAAGIADDARPRPLTVKADVDCDGVDDAAQMTYVDGRVHVTVTLAATQARQSLEFGLGDSMAQDSLCGTEVTLVIEGMDYDLVEAFGENPEGFRQSRTCKGLRVEDNECDSMHIFWNHETRHIDWWRL